MSENENMYDVRGQFHKKFNMARAAIYTADWEPDKAFKIQGTLVPYVSINKMKRNIAPALLKNGIDFAIEFDDLQLRTNGQSSYWSAQCMVTFYDQDTGYSESSTAIGGCGATDKGMNICQTFALKNVLSNLFLIIDGIEPEDLENASASGTFRKKTEEEVEEVKSEILANKDVVKAPKASKEEKAPKEEKASEDKPKAKVKTEVKSIDVDAPPSDGPKFELEGAQKNTVAKILKDWETARDKGQTENYDKMMESYKAMASIKDVLAFIRTYKVVF